VTDFFRFPHTPHLAWLGEGRPRDDKVLSRHELDAFLSGDTVVEEKVDGANIGISADDDGTLLVQSRGSYLQRGLAHPQFRLLWPWLQRRESALIAELQPGLIVFGEWCYAVHSITYTRLPDWFLGFDVWDRSVGRFWDASRRDALMTGLHLHPATRIAAGHFTIEELAQFMSLRSHFGESKVEGLIVRRERDGFTLDRAKLVRAEFAQSIDEHWSRGPLRRNRLTEGALWR